MPHAPYPPAPPKPPRSNPPHTHPSPPEPVRTHDFYNRRMEEDYWAPCVRAMLSVDDFLEQMRQCRQLRPTLHPTKWRKLRDIAQSPFFDPDIGEGVMRIA